jgi:hypothetical protein
MIDRTRERRIRRQFQLKPVFGGMSSVPFERRVMASAVFSRDTSAGGGADAYSESDAGGTNPTDSQSDSFPYAQGPTHAYLDPQTYDNSGSDAESSYVTNDFDTPVSSTTSGVSVSVDHEGSDSDAYGTSEYSTADGNESMNISGGTTFAISFSASISATATNGTVTPTLTLSSTFLNVTIDSGGFVAKDGSGTVIQSDSNFGTTGQSDTASVSFNVSATTYMSLLYSSELYTSAASGASQSSSFTWSFSVTS